jgi:hypothetical protein
VEPTGPSWACAAKVHGADIDAVVRVWGYHHSALFVGIVVPFIPVVPFPFPYVAMGDEVLGVDISLESGTDAGVIQPDSLRVLLGGREFAARSIRVIVAHGPEPPPDQPLPATTHALVAYEFDLASPRVPFSVVVRGLPRIDYTSRFHFFLDYGDPL